MKKTIFNTLMILSIIMISCDEEDTQVLYSDNIINNSLLDAIISGETEGDAFVINSLKTENGKLLVNVSYGGGCEVHDFNLAWNGQCTLSNSETENQFAIIHNANGDNCEAWLTRDLMFDYHAMMDGQVPIECNNAPIYFINASNSQSYFTFPEISNITQGTECLYEVELEAAMCSSGFLDDLWFKSTDSSLYEGMEYFYFQPTNIAVDEVFEKGKYKIGVRIVPAYIGEGVYCLAYPGPSVAADILCIERVGE